MAKLSAFFLILIILSGCVSSDSIVTGGSLEIGQSKLAAKSPFLMSSLAEDPFLCQKCKEFYASEKIEIVWNRNETLFLVFENVTQPQRSYDDRKLGDGRLAGYYGTYEEAFAVVERKKQEEIIRVAAERAEEEKRRKERLAEEAKRREEQRRLAAEQAERRQAEAEAARLEQQRKERLRVAKERESLLAMTPVSCQQLIAAVNANEARARRNFPQRKIRVEGVVTDVNVTSESRCCNLFTGGYYMAEIAVVHMKEEDDFLNGCKAEMNSFDEAIDLDKGDRFDFLCDGWDESFGNITFEECQLFQNALD
jgi:hypothetical protein